MKFIFNILCIIILSISCESKSQNTVKNKTVNMNANESVLKKFDIQKYENKLQKDPYYEGYKTEDNIQIDQYYLMDDKHFSGDYNRQYVSEYIEKKNYSDGFADFYIYNNKGVLLQYKRYFDDIETGIWKTYTVDGKIIKSEDKDDHYPFSIKEVIVFSKKNKGNLSEHGLLKRIYDEPLKKYVYKAEWISDKNGDDYLQGFILDGNNGSVLKKYEKDSPKRLR